MPLARRRPHLFAFGDIKVCGQSSQNPKTPKTRNPVDLIYFSAHSARDLIYLDFSQSEELRSSQKGLSHFVNLCRQIPGIAPNPPVAADVQVRLMSDAEVAGMRRHQIVLVVVHESISATLVKFDKLVATDEFEEEGLAWDDFVCTLRLPRH